MNRASLGCCVHECHRKLGSLTRHCPLKALDIGESEWPLASLTISPVRFHMDLQLLLKPVKVQRIQGERVISEKESMDDSEAGTRVQGKATWLLIQALFINVEHIHVFRMEGNGFWVCFC